MDKVNTVLTKRHEFAFKMKELMAEKKYTKARLCEEAGISRPTLDKLLAGNITNMSSFKKYLSKISKCLGVDSESLVCGMYSEEIAKDRYLKHKAFKSAKELEDFANNTVKIEIVNVSSFAENLETIHMLWYWLYTDRTNQK